MRVCFLALHESPHRSISLKQQGQCECGPRRVRVPPGSGTSPPSGAPIISDAANPWGSSSSTGEMPRAGAALASPGPSLAGTDVAWQWFLSSSGDGKDHFNALAYTGLNSSPSQKQPPVAKTVCRRMRFSAWVIGKIRPLGSQERSLSALGAKLLPKEHSKQASFILRWGKKNSLAEIGWQEYATGCQVHKGINTIMLTLKNCLTKQDRQPLLIIRIASGH